MHQLKHLFDVGLGLLQQHQREQVAQCASLRPLAVMVRFHFGRI